MNVTPPHTIELRSLFGEGSDAPGAAPFARALARVVASHHNALGGDASDAVHVESAAYAVTLAEDEGQPCLPPEAVAAWVDALMRSPVVASRGDADRPLVLDYDGRLYLQRWFAYEQALSRAWCERSISAPLFRDVTVARATLDRLFDVRTEGQPFDAQRLAVAVALLRRACVISGGPGTGKTTTIARLIEAALTLDPNASIALAAPTGKAAARIAEALRGYVEQASLAPDVAARWPQGAVTVHKLIEASERGAGARRNRARPIAASIVIIDEASMLGLSLATQLFDALATDARLVLLGDKDQLASVETGLVFAQLAQGHAFDTPTRDALHELGVEAPGAATSDKPVQAVANAVVWLERNYRFDTTSSIARFASAVRGGDVDAAFSVLQANGDVHLREDHDALSQAVFDAYSAFVHAVIAHTSIDVVLVTFARHRALCALREGVGNPRSAEGLNARVEQLLKARLGVPSHAAWYAGRAVLVERNDASLGLFNGDIGVAWPDESHVLQVVFTAPDGTLRRVHPARLPAHCGAFALSVHKAQGSEYETIDVVLPTVDTRVSTRELLYTAVTRARSCVRLWSNPSELGAAIARATNRSSGLEARLEQALRSRTLERDA